MNVETDGSSADRARLQSSSFLLTLPGISYTSRPPAAQSGPRCFRASLPRVCIQPRAGLRAQLTSHGPPRGGGDPRGAGWGKAGLGWGHSRTGEPWGQKGLPGDPARSSPLWVVDFPTIKPAGWTGHP